MPSVPRSNGILRELGRQVAGLSEPPVPVPVGSPVWAMKPGMTRWKTIPS